MDILVVTFLAGLVTKIVDTIRNAVDLKDQFPKVIWNLAAFGVGVLLAFGFEINLFVDLGGLAGLGTGLTGIVLGAGGSLVHEVADALSARGHSGNPKVPGD